MKDKSKKYYIETYGCQMNKYDSELVAGILNQEGYQPARTLEESDLILVNTCSVRQHAENRVFGRLDALRLLKKQRPEVIIGVLGCMAMRWQDELLHQKPFVNFVLGPDNYRGLPSILDKLGNGSRNSQLKLAEFDDHEVYSDMYPSRTSGVSAWVAIMRGCNNFCSYCIVPYVRGRERSRAACEVVREVQRLVQQNFVEVALLGQNVNSYHDGENDFADLIRMVAEVPGIQRVRFATSHPKDLSPRLIDAMAEQANICHHLHLPVQSGSDHVLQLMNRKYTRAHYLNLIESLRAKIPDVGLYTDIIVGFPGETEQDFELTMQLVEQVKFDGIFVFKFSPREGTAAYRLKETVSEAEKVRRLEQLNAIQDAITLEKNQQMVGTVVQILVEGRSRKSRAHQYMGRTESNKIVVFQGDPTLVGRLIDVKIVAAEGRTLFGEPI